MSNAIRDVSETLIELLRSEMKDLFTSDAIALISPAEAAESGEVRLGLSLYSVAPSAYFRNELEVFGDTDRNEPLSQPLDLYYLLTAFPVGNNDHPTERTLGTQHVLGLAMRILFDNGVLTGSILRGSLPRDQELRLTLQPTNLEDLTRIWALYPDTALNPSVTYVVSPVKLLSTRTVRGPRVTRRKMDVDNAIPVREEL